MSASKHSQLLFRAQGTVDTTPYDLMAEAIVEFTALEVVGALDQLDKGKNVDSVRKEYEGILEEDEGR